MDDLQLYIRHTLGNLVKGLQRLGNVSALSRALGKTPTNMVNILEKWGVPIEEVKEGTFDLTNEFLDTKYYNLTSEGEVWKRSTIDSNIFVSNKCNIVIILANGMVAPVIPQKNNNTSWYTKYTRNKQTKSYNLATLIATEFTPNPEGNHVASFKDGVLDFNNLHWTERRRIGKNRLVSELKDSIKPMFKTKPSIEEWKDSPTYPQWFEVSNHGRARMKDYFNDKGLYRQGKILSTPIGRHSIHAVRHDSFNNPIKVSFVIGKEVALAFVPNPNNYEHLYYINGLVGGASVDNLVWVEQPIRKSSKEYPPIPSKKDFINAMVFNHDSIGDIMKREFGRPKSHFRIIAEHHGLPMLRRELIQMYELATILNELDELYKDTREEAKVQSLTGEEWVNTWGPFYVSNLGRVKKVLAPNIEHLVEHIPSSEAPRVYLSYNGKQENLLVKKLVYYTFNPEDKGCRVYHVDGDIKNCKLSNLTKQYTYKPRDKYLTLSIN